MKIFHLSDLHIGKILNGYSLLENQQVVLNQIVQEAKKHRPDVILLCGDIYDRTVPAGEAYKLLDEFLVNLSDIEPKIPVLIIAGNHDSPDRLSYAESFLEKHQIYVSVMPPQTKKEYLKKVTLTDEYGAVHFYLLPFLKPGYVRGLNCNVSENACGLEENDSENSVEKLRKNAIDNYESAVQMVLDRETIDFGERNVILSHQFYAGRGHEIETCESEQSVIMAGGLDRISAEVLENFDYAALGHIHGSQRTGAEHIRYCGTPYKYSISEEHHNKSITVVTLKEKGSEPEISFLPLRGIQDVRRLKGTLKEVLEQAKEESRHDYVSVTLTDEQEPYHFREQLEEVYDHLLEVRIDNSRTRKKLTGEMEAVQVLQPLAAFEQFYETMLGRPMDEQERTVMESIIEQEKEERA